MSRIFPALFMCINFALAAQAGWHTNAWTTVRGTDTNAYVDLQATEVDEIITQTATGSTNTIPGVELPYDFGRVSDGPLDQVKYEYMPARSTNEVAFTNNFFMFLSKNVYMNVNWPEGEYSWTNEFEATNSYGDAFDVVTILNRDYTIWRGTNETTRAPLDTSTYDQIREVELWLAFAERAQFASNFDDSLYAELSFYRESWRSNLGGLKSFSYNVYPGAYPDYLSDMIADFVVPMDN